MADDAIRAEEGRAININFSLSCKKNPVTFYLFTHIKNKSDYIRSLILNHYEPFMPVEKEFEDGTALEGEQLMDAVMEQPDAVYPFHLTLTPKDGSVYVYESGEEHHSKGIKNLVIDDLSFENLAKHMIETDESIKSAFENQKNEYKKKYMKRYMKKYMRRHRDRMYSVTLTFKPGWNLYNDEDYVLLRLYYCPYVDYYLKYIVKSIPKHVLDVGPFNPPPVTKDMPMNEFLHPVLRQKYTLWFDTKEDAIIINCLKGQKRLSSEIVTGCWDGWNRNKISVMVGRALSKDMSDPKGLWTNWWGPDDDDYYMPLVYDPVPMDIGDDFGEDSEEVSQENPETPQ